MMTTRVVSTISLLLALSAVPAVAQVQAQAPARPQPPAPQAYPAPVVPQPAPPVRPAPRGGAAALPASNTPATPAPSVLPPPAKAPAPTAPLRATPVVQPANATARCNDGSFVVAPNGPAACGAHGGLLMAVSQVPTPTPPVPGAAHVAALPAVRAPSGPPPAGATLQCKDGTYLYGPTSAGACAANGGAAALMVQPRPAPAPPAHQKRP